MKRQSIAAALAVLILSCPGHAKEAADLVLYHGKVLTVDEAFSIKSALVVKDGKVLVVGDDTLAQKYEAPTRIDLQGRTLMPGFMDNHLHPMTRGKRAIDAERAKSITDIQSMYTYNPTFLTWDEHRKGTLEPGKFADFIILDSDPLTIPPEKLLTLKVLQTFIGGKKVYSANN